MSTREPEPVSETPQNEPPIELETESLTSAPSDDEERKAPRQEGDTQALPTEPLLSQHESEINQALESTHRLIAYASQAGKEIPPETIQTVLAFAEKVPQKSWNSKDESGLWEAVSKLTRAVAPVTIDSLQATLRNKGKSLPKATLEVWMTGFLTVTLLIFLIWVQFDWVVISNVSTEIQALTKQRKDSNAQIFRLNDQLGLLKTQKEVLLGGEDSRLPSEQDEKDRKKLIGDIASTRDELEKERVKLDQHNKSLRANYRILEGWLPFIGWLDSAKPPDPGLFDSDDVAGEKLKAIERWRKNRQLDSESHNETLLSWAKQIIQGMSSYLLPMIYGLVGACAYVLRSLSKAIREVSFSSSSTIQYRLRLLLGALAGISVGWFLRPEATGSELAAIQPLALAFLAGYSVELVFAAMDKIITAFIGDQRTPT